MWLLASAAPLLHLLERVAELAELRLHGAVQLPSAGRCWIASDLPHLQAVRSAEKVVR